MKRVYQKPDATIARASFEEHILASGGSIVESQCTIHYSHVGHSYEGFEDVTCAEGGWTQGHWKGHHENDGTPVPGLQ